MEGCPAEERGEGDEALVAGDGFHFFEDRELPVGREAVGTECDARVGIEEGLVVGQAVFYVQIGVGARGPVRVWAPGLRGGDVLAGRERIVDEKRAIIGVEVLERVMDGGFADNEVYINLAAQLFRPYKLRSTHLPQGSALGAALAVSGKPVQTDLLKKQYAMKKHKAPKGA